MRMLVNSVEVTIQVEQNGKDVDMPDVHMRPAFRINSDSYDGFTTLDDNLYSALEALGNWIIQSEIEKNLVPSEDDELRVVLDAYRR